MTRTEIITHIKVFQCKSPRLDYIYFELTIDKDFFRTIAIDLTEVESKWIERYIRNLMEVFVEQNFLFGDKKYSNT